MPNHFPTVTNNGINCRRKRKLNSRLHKPSVNINRYELMNKVSRIEDDRNYGTRRLVIVDQKIPDPYTTHKEQSIHWQMDTAESKDTLTNRTFEEWLWKGLGNMIWIKWTNTSITHHVVMWRVQGILDERYVMEIGYDQVVTFVEWNFKLELQT